MMVKIGDTIVTKNGMGIVTRLLKTLDNRWVIVYSNFESTKEYILIEGDEEYEVLK